MSNRRKYDHYEIEIQRWNRDNIVEKIDCDCAQLAKKVRGEHEVLGDYLAMINN